MRPPTAPTVRPTTLRRSTANLALVLTLLLAACSGAADTASSDTATTDAATTASADTTEAAEAPTGDGLAGSEDPVDPAVGAPDPAVCEGALAVVQLIGDASNPENDDDQIRDAVELMGQAIGDLEAAGADPAIVEAAEAIHEQFAVVVNDPTVEPDYAVVEAAGAVLGGLVQSCGITAEDI